jgi:hypothetical protein
MLGINMNAKNRAAQRAKAVSAAPKDSKIIRSNPFFLYLKPAIKRTKPVKKDNAIDVLILICFPF